MSMLTLPRSLKINGEDHLINYDFRYGVKIMQMFEDPDLSEAEKAEMMVGILFVDEPDMSNGEYFKQAYWFINEGEDVKESNVPDHGRLMSWRQDLKFIVSGVDKVLGKSCRRERLHWWEFMSAYREISDSLFAILIQQRKLRNTGKQTKEDREWWSDNENIAYLEPLLTKEEQQKIAEFEGRA